MKNKKKIVCAIVLISTIAAVLWFAKDNKTSTTVFNGSIDTGDIEEVVYEEKNYTTELENSVTLEQSEEILITSSGTYEFSGEYLNSSIVVNVDKDVDKDVVYLVLNNATIQSDVTAPINILEAKDVVIVVEENTTNTITQGSIVTSDEEFPSGAIYSKADLAIVGSGVLNVTTEYNDGINSRDDLIIEETTINVTAVGDGIVGKDYIAISDVNINIESQKDGIKSTNTEDLDRGNIIIKSGTFDIVSQTDGISSSNTLQIDGGTFNILSGGGFEKVLNIITVGEGSGNTVSVSSQLENSMKGLKANDMLLNDGTFYISSYEDAIHSDNDLTINGGTYTILSGDDAVHADNMLYINGGKITVEEGYEGIEGSCIIINGGDINVSVLDDAINAGSEEGYLRVTGGNIYLKSSGDGMDSNGDMYIEGGTIILDIDAIYTGGDSEIDVTGEYSHTGGTVQDENGNDLEPSEMGQGGMQGGPGTMQNERPSGGTQDRQQTMTRPGM